MSKIALIVAGGTGLRMGSSLPKQFLLLKGKPVLIHTIEKFHSSHIFSSIIVVLPSSEISYWEKLKVEHSFNIPHTIIAGGTSRFDSVKNGLASIQESEGQIAIHDGVRPLVSVGLIKKCIDELENSSNAIPAIPIFDSLRRIENGNSKVVDRSQLRAIQTPQCFQLSMLKSAYQISGSGSTDDASVFELAGNTIHLIEGEKSNIKITVQEDLVYAETLLP